MKVVDADREEGAEKGGKEHTSKLGNGTGDGAEGPCVLAATYNSHLHKEIKHQIQDPL